MVSMDVASRMIIRSLVEQMTVGCDRYGKILQKKVLYLGFECRLSMLCDDFFNRFQCHFDIGFFFCGWVPLFVYDFAVNSFKIEN